MADITAKMVKDLREQTGAGMMDCKKALKETDGNVEAAIDWLRQKGLSKAAKKAGRTAADGLVVVSLNDAGTVGTVTEVNAETDFVARNEMFQKMVAEIGKVALDVDGDTDVLAGTAFPGSDKNVAEYVESMVATIGEHMALRRFAKVSVDQGTVVPYIHTPVVPGAGKIGVLIGLKTAGDASALAGVGKQLAMHVAATNPMAGTVDEVDADVLERERKVLLETNLQAGKPQELAEKIVQGQIGRFYKDNVLMEQIFVMDGETKIADVIKNASKEAGAPVEFAGFARFELGDGIEVEEEDFAAEVASMVS